MTHCRSGAFPFDNVIVALGNRLASTVCILPQVDSYEARQRQMLAKDVVPVLAITMYAAFQWKVAERVHVDALTVV